MGIVCTLLHQLVFADCIPRWYCHLQNDCKNIYSSDVVAAKGALAEDLINGEYSFPVVAALYSSVSNRVVVEQALRQGKGLDAAAVDRQHHAALAILQSQEIKDFCMDELSALKSHCSKFATVWGREEEMNLGTAEVQRNSSKNSV